MSCPRSLRSLGRLGAITRDCRPEPQNVDSQICSGWWSRWHLNPCPCRFVSLHRRLWRPTSLSSAVSLREPSATGRGPRTETPAGHDSGDARRGYPFTARMLEPWRVRATLPQTSPIDVGSGPPCFSRCVPHSQLLGRRGHCLFGRSSWPGGWLRLRDAAGSLGRNRVTIRVGSDPGSAGARRNWSERDGRAFHNCMFGRSRRDCRRLPGCTACSGISRSVSQCSRNVRSRALILFIMQAWCSRSSSPF